MFPKEQQSPEVCVRCSWCLRFRFEEIKQVVSFLVTRCDRASQRGSMLHSFSPSQKPRQCIAWMRSCLESLSCLMQVCFGKPCICFSLESQDIFGKPNLINLAFGKPFTLSLSLTCLFTFVSPVTLAKGHERGVVKQCDSCQNCAFHIGFAFAC